MPLFVNTSTEFTDPSPQYRILLDASKLIGARALLDIKQGDLPAGLAAIEGDLDLYKKMSQSEHVCLIDLMVAMAGIKINLMEISKIIKDERVDLTGHEDRLRKLLDLDLNPGPIITPALKFEKWRTLQGVAELGANWYDDGLAQKD